LGTDWIRVTRPCNALRTAATAARNFSPSVRGDR
jgi:hypothetical protein